MLLGMRHLNWLVGKCVQGRVFDLICGQPGNAFMFPGITIEARVTRAAGKGTIPQRRFCAPSVDRRIGPEALALYGCKANHGKM